MSVPVTKGNCHLPEELLVVPLRGDHVLKELGHVLAFLAWTSTSEEETNDASDDKANRQQDPAHLPFSGRISIFFFTDPSHLTLSP